MRKNLLPSLVAICVLLANVRAASAQPYVHPIDFHIPSIWYDLPDIQQRLGRYVDDINVIYARGTVRQFTLGQVHRRDLPSSSGTSATKVPLVGTYTFAVFVDSNLNGFPASHGGSAGFQMPGREGQNELSALGFHWKDVWSSAALQDPNNASDYYDRQIRNIVHELGHLDGLGLSEYYSLSSTDATGVAPTENLTQIPISSYWSQRSLAYQDPMRACTYAQCEYSPLSKYIINRAASGYYDTHGCSRGYYFACSSVTAHSITVKTVSSANGGALPWCSVQVYGRGPNSTASNATLLYQSGTDGTGQYTFTSKLTHSNFDNLHLVKAQCWGYAPQSQWISLFDIQAFQQGMVGGGAAGDFRYPGQMLLSMVPLCGNGVCDTYENCVSCPGDCTCTASWTLTSVTSSSKTITASKSGGDPTCAHLLTPNYQPVSNYNHCCFVGGCSDTAAPTGLFQVGQQVRLCHGNNYNNCSNTVTITP